VPDGDYVVPLGQARIAREGTDVTLIAYGAMVNVCELAADAADVSCEVVDIRSLRPLDEAAILASVAKTGRVVIVHEAPRTCGFGAELIASIQERAMAYLEAPILRVTGFDTPFPYSLEHEYLPNPDRVMRAIRQTLEW
jgi:2-oxoisovalerate dehydrogenase E1 component beta subunit